MARNQNTRMTVTVSRMTGNTCMIRLYSRRGGGSGNTTASSLAAECQRGGAPNHGDTISSLPAGWCHGLLYHTISGRVLTTPPGGQERALAVLLYFFDQTFVQPSVRVPGTGSFWILQAHLSR
jgi:hypothetical protein